MNYILILFFSSNLLANIDIKDNKIVISNDAHFESKLETGNFIKSGKEAYLRETGYIVASTQSAFENDRFISRWVTLDPVILKNNDIKLENLPPAKGRAYGIIATSKDFESEIKTGQTLSIKRYGLDQDNFSGKVIGVVKKQSKDIIEIHFLATNAQELIAGTTCEVEISHIKIIPLTASLLSLLHLGLEDYILIKEKPGVYFPKHVTIIDQDEKSATILARVNPKLQYVSRGAILLKPLLNKIINPKEVAK